MAIALAFWLSGSVILDVLIMPVLYTTGMMSEPGFATAGYSLFWVFNRLELLCAAIVLTGALIYWRTQLETRRHWQPAILAALLLTITLVCTYVLTPQMSVLGLQLNLFAPTVETPALMNSLHVSYWFLEVAKLAIGGLLLKLCFNSTSQQLTLSQP